MECFFFWDNEGGGMRRIQLAVVAWLVFGLVLGVGFAQSASVEPFGPAFVCIVLGSGGGPREDNVSGYMLWPVGKAEEAIILDPGTLTVGIRKADELGNLWEFRVPAESNLTREGWILQNAKAYLISHAHLDHIAAMVLNSPEDSAKDILARSVTITHLQNHIFNWEVWPNFGNAGPGFPLGKYRYVTLEPGKETPISRTSMTVEAFPLSHSAPYESTAFLIHHEGSYILYCGDTGPDQVEKSDYLYKVWERIAPLVREGKLAGLFLEISYPQGRADTLLFGHLTPGWMMKELHRLAELVNPDSPSDALEGLKVVVTHVKPVFTMTPTPGYLISQQLEELNDLGVVFIVPFQGMRLEF